jgi:hypothetical protein
MTGDALDILNDWIAGVDPECADRLEKVASEQATSYSVEDVALAASLAKVAYEVAGMDHNEDYDAFCALVRKPGLTAGHRKIASVVFSSLGRVMRAPMDKEAFLSGPKVLNALKAVVGASSALTPDMLKIIVGAGGLTGALGGAAVYGAQRGVTNQDAKLREEEVRRDTYNSLAKEIDDELKRRQLSNTPNNQAAVADYLT